MKAAVRLCACCNQHISTTNHDQTTQVKILAESESVYTVDYAFGAPQKKPESLTSEFYQCFKGVHHTVIGTGNYPVPEFFGNLSFHTISYLMKHPLSHKSAMFCSFFRIQSENILDLLQDSDPNRQFHIRESPDGMILIENVAEFRVNNPAELNFLLNRGLENPESTGSLVLQISLESDTFTKVTFCKCEGYLEFRKLLACLSSGKKHNEFPLSHALKDTLNLKSKLLLVPFLCEKAVQESCEAMNLIESCRNLKFTYGSAKKPIVKRTISPDVSRKAKKEITISEVLEMRRINDELRAKLNALTNDEVIEKSSRASKSMDLHVKKIRSSRTQSQVTKEKLLAYKEKKMKREIEVIRREEEEKKTKDITDKKKEKERKTYLEAQKKKIDEYRANKRVEPPTVAKPANQFVRPNRKLLVDNFSEKSNIINNIVDESFHALNVFKKQ